MGIRLRIGGLVIAISAAVSAGPISGAGAATGGPTGLHVAENGATSIQWVWAAYPSATRYRLAVSRSRTMSDPTFRWVSDRWSTSWQLPARSTFYASVRALTSAGLSVPSPVVAGHTSPVPTGLHTIKRTSTTLTWSWTEYRNAPRFELQLSPNRDFVARRSRITSGATGIDFYGLDPGRTYYARVRGLNQDWTPYTLWSATGTSATTS